MGNPIPQAPVVSEKKTLLSCIGLLMVCTIIYTFIYVDVVHMFYIKDKQFQIRADMREKTTISH